MKIFTVVTEVEIEVAISISEVQVGTQNIHRTFLAESFEVVHKHVAETFADEQLIAIVGQQTVVTVLAS